MKSFVLWKLPLILASLVAALVLTPASKAQSEVDPDHFDGTDSWQTAVAHQAPTPGHNQSKTLGQTQALNKKQVSSATVQLAAARQTSQSARPEAVALQDKRKAAIRKPDNK